MDNIIYITFDFETTSKTPLIPMDPEIRPVALGVRIQMDVCHEYHKYLFPVCWGHHVKKRERLYARIQTLLALDMLQAKVDLEYPVMFVGHNIGYDLIMLKKLCAATGYMDMYNHIFLRRTNVYVWDTQIAEYMLSGQEHTYPSLGSLIDKYDLGVSHKDFLEPYIKHQIPIPTLYPLHELPTVHPWLHTDADQYLMQDLGITYVAMREQFEIATESPELLQLILYQCKFRLWTVEMEHAGIHMDLKSLRTTREDVENSRDNEYHKYIMNLRAMLRNWASDVVIDRVLIQYKATGTKILGALLYGGTLDYTQATVKKDEHGKIMRTKAGKLKSKMMPYRIIIPALLSLTDLNRIMYYPPDTEGRLDDTYLRTIINRFNDIGVHPADAGMLIATLESLLNYRSDAKELDTYIGPYLNPRSKNLSIFDGVLHPRLQHTATSTGRLASSGPNILNLPRDDDD